MDVDLPDSDEEVELQDINRLTSVLEDDPPISDTASLCSVTKADSIISAGSSTSNETCKIDTAIALNRLTDDKLQKLEKILQQRLHECRARLAEIQNNTLSDKLDNTDISSVAFCRRPYFKDNHCFVAPDNEDTILMKKSQMFDFSFVSMVPGWTINDKTKFLKIIATMSIDVRRSRLNSQISQLLREMKEKPRPGQSRDLRKLQNQCVNVKTMSVENLVLPPDEEYDWDSIAVQMNLRHSAHEYRTLWKLFLHPSINKDAWTKQEHTLLQKISNEQNMQDWDKIAQMLGTNRTGYQCFVYFRTNLSNTFTGQKWTKEEEGYLRRLIEFYKEDDHIPWGRVASSMENRTKMQLYNKYMRLIELRKGRFLPEEDAVILTCIENFGKNFKRMTKYLPGRSMLQIRRRSKLLENRRISNVWSIEDDEKLIQMMPNFEMQRFSSLAKYFPGKDRTNIRSRCITLTKWMKVNPNVGLEHAPRRGARCLGRASACENLNKAVEKLKNKIQTNVQIKKNKKKISKESPEDVLDDAILAALITEQIKDNDSGDILETAQQIDEDEIDHDSNSESPVSDIKQLLILLKAKLNHSTFKNSYFNTKYPGLSDLTEKSVVKVKSYSRKEKVKNIENAAPEPNIWGKNTLKDTTYVLPPNYSTITGCRQLMTYLAKTQLNENKMNISLLCRKNSVLKEQIDKLMDRIHLLFMWPLILSNGFPKTLEEHSSTISPPESNKLKM